MMNQISGAVGSGGSAYSPTSKNESVSEKSTGALWAAKTDRFEHVGGASLSEKAQGLLKELQAKYGDTDFIIADYSSDEEASRLLASGRKEYSVLIDPATLEEMAADESVRARYEGMIENSRSQIRSVVDELLVKGESAHAVGATVSEDGTMKMFAVLDEMSARRNEQLEESRETAREEKAEEKKEAEEEKKSEKAEKTKEDGSSRGGRHGRFVRIFADTAEGLLKKIFNFFGVHRSRYEG